VEKIHHTWSFGSDATVLYDYALTTTTSGYTGDCATYNIIVDFYEFSFKKFCLRFRIRWDTDFLLNVVHISE